ncbi:hypothetical protein JOQ06_029585 [Pogonophryne albipinna]|uniref:G protein-coupled receptor kinase n=1 Tax=Pogonophryne albipinna TaxID=1090488 RepID=A0AAD6AES4_9TELE|nr:hypothetical protein JOQ06_029585 [Pogonophryne albipinna]
MSSPLQYSPPLIPPRGEVNAADAFDIGSFDEEDTKGIKLLDSDQELYKNFPLVISERWQQEVAETVYEAVNSDTDKNEARKRAKNKQLGHEEGEETQTCPSRTMFQTSGPQSTTRSFSRLSLSLLNR